MDSENTIDCDSMLRQVPGDYPQATRKDSRCASRRRAWVTTRTTGCVARELLTGDHQGGGLMRKLLLVTLGFVIAVGTLVAQTHDNQIEKKANDVVLFTTDVRVGATVLKAGEYRVVCDTKKVTFTRQALAKDQEWRNTLDPVERLAVQKPEKALEVPCLGKDVG